MSRSFELSVSYPQGLSCVAESARDKGCEIGAEKVIHYQITQLVVSMPKPVAMRLMPTNNIVTLMMDNWRR